MRVFVSYRREDEYFVTDIRNTFSRLRGPSSVFTDRELVPGERWADRLRGEISQSTHMIVVIAPGWSLEALALDNDPVRAELLAAKEFDCIIVPLVVEPTRVPSLSDLPPDLTFLLDHHAMSVSAAHKDRDLEQLVLALSPEEHLRYDVVYFELGPAPVVTARRLRALAPTLTLGAVADLVQGEPIPGLTDIAHAEAVAAFQQLNEFGAKVEIRRS